MPQLETSAPLTSPYSLRYSELLLCYEMGWGTEYPGFLLVHTLWPGSPSSGGCADRAASLVALQSMSGCGCLSVSHEAQCRPGTDAVHGRDGSQLTGLGFRWWE